MPRTSTGETGFDEWFLTAVNSSAVILMISVGHRTGLFDVMSNLDWTDSVELAEAADLNERYVREWLAALATGGVVEVDGEDRYRLPHDHARFLTRDTDAENLAVFAQYIPVLGGVEDEIVKCFREGGGVSYEQYNRFHEVMAEDSGLTVVAALEEHILPLVPGLRERLESGIEVLDLGCGRGKALMTMADLYPKSRFHGFDFSEETIAWAREEARGRGLDNLDFEVRDATDFDVSADPEAYDLVTTFDAVHDQARPAAVLRGIYRTLKPGGVYLMQDIHSTGHVQTNMDHPMGPLLYTVSCMHCMTVSLAQGGDGLGTMWGREKARELLTAAGFGEITIHQLEHDIQNDYYVMRK